MIFSVQNIAICSYWRNRPINGKQYLDQAQSFLRKIILMLPELAILRVARNPEESTGIVEHDFSNFEQEVIGGLPEDWAYFGPDPEYKGFTKESVPGICFYNSFSLTSNDCKKEIAIQMSVGHKINGSSDVIIIDISPEFEDLVKVKKLLDLCVDFWQPKDACVSRREVRRHLNQTVGDAYVGWLTYLSDPAASEYLPADIRWEYLPPGIVIYASETPGPRDGSEGADNMRRIISALSPHGFLKNR